MDDLNKSVDSIKKLGSDFRFLETGNKRVICSVAVELNSDHMDVLRFAETKGGMVTYTSMRQAMSAYADKSRFERAINTLIEDGMAWEDGQEPSGETSYWFPSLMQSSNVMDASSLKMAQ